MLTRRKLLKTTSLSAMGLFFGERLWADVPLPPAQIITMENFPNAQFFEKAHYQLAKQAAGEGIVLLKNNGVLPLKTGTISLFGSGTRQTKKRVQDRVM